MEKVVLTKEQAERIEELREKHKSNFMIIRNASFTDPRGKTVFDNPDKLVKALYFGYEIKEQYKKGDWVKLKDRNEAIKLRYDWMVDQANGIHYERIRPATDEEASAEWFKRHGREHWELRYNDILIDEQGNLYSFVEECGALLELYSCHVCGVKLKSYEELQDNFQIVCFAEDRKDR